MNVKRRDNESKTQYFLRNMVMASTSACIAEAVTIPLDTAKVRLQLQRKVEGQKPRYNGLIGTVRMIATEEGYSSLFAGLSAGLQRQMIFSGLRVGLYFEIRNWITGPLPEGQFPTLMQKIKTAILSGSIAITVANPCDVVKIKLQSQGRLLAQGIPP